MKVSIQFAPPFAGMAVWLHERRPDGEYVVMPVALTLKKLGSFGEWPEPTFRFSEPDGMEFLNSLCDALVKAGFKPDEIKASDKQIETIKYHLEDMRRLVFNKLSR